MDRAVDGHAKREKMGLQVPSELYHLASDPRQENDVIEQHPDVVKDLRERLVAWLESVGTAQEFVDPWR